MLCSFTDETGLVSEAGRANASAGAEESQSNLFCCRRSSTARKGVIDTLPEGLKYAVS